MSDNKEHYHNKGQEDASNDKYDPPHGLLDEVLTWSSSEMDRNAEENAAYDAGWRHTHDQD